MERSDARRNRERLVNAALEVFAERGMDAPLEEVARRAKVGIGTLYRRFPDRKSLIRAVSISGLERLASIAHQAYEEEPDAWQALTRFLRQSVAMRVGDLAATLDPELHREIRRDPVIGQVRANLLGVLERMVDDAQWSAMLRPDVGAGDVLLLSVMLSRRERELPANVADIVPVRFMELAIDGLRATSAASPLPGQPVLDVHRDEGVSQRRTDDRAGDRADDEGRLHQGEGSTALATKLPAVTGRTMRVSDARRLLAGAFRRTRAVLATLLPFQRFAELSPHVVLVCLGRFPFGRG